MPDGILQVNGLEAFYGDFQALFGLSLEVGRGEIVAVNGANGAGKSTLLKCIAGLVRTRPESVCFEGRRIGGLPAERIAATGIALVPEGRRLLASLSVEENLRIGGQLKRPGPWNLERIYEFFPVLAERRKVPSTSLSGGQQQMVAIGRALMSNPSLLLCDELSLGLAPIMVKEIYAQLSRIAGAGMSIVIVEQDIGQALKIAARVYCLRTGHVVLSGASNSITRRDIAAAYFGD
jgi:branched-chain amino acid transport system ATP-binding protein